MYKFKLLAMAFFMTLMGVAPTFAADPSPFFDPKYSISGFKDRQCSGIIIGLGSAFESMIGKKLWKIYSEYLNPTNDELILFAQEAEFTGERRTVIPSVEDEDVYQDSEQYRQSDESIRVEDLADQTFIPDSYPVQVPKIKDKIALRFFEFSTKSRLVFFPEAKELYYLFMSTPIEAERFVKSLTRFQARYLLYSYFDEWSKDETRKLGWNRIQNALFFLRMNQVGKAIGACIRALIPKSVDSTRKADSE